MSCDLSTQAGFFEREQRMYHDIEKKEKPTRVMACPFCGMAPTLQKKVVNEQSSHPTTIWWYECTNNQCGGFTTWNKSVEEALDKWNTRQ